MNGGRRKRTSRDPLTADVIKKKSQTNGGGRGKGRGRGRTYSDYYRTTGLSCMVYRVNSCGKQD